MFRIAQAGAAPTSFTEHPEYLSPGQWIPVVSKERVWRHIDAQLPKSLTEATWSGVVDSVQSPPRKRAYRIAWRSALLLGRAVWLMRPPGRLTVPPTFPRRGNATVLRHTGDNRAEVIAFEESAGRVFRLGQPGSYNDEYVAVRRLYERYLPAPRFSVQNDGSVLVEEWCEGSVLKSMDGSLRAEVALDVLKRYAELVANEHRHDDGTPWGAIPRLLGEVALPASLRDLLADPRAQCLLGSGLLVPSHGGSVGPRDIIVDGSCGSKYRIVDFDKAGWRPVWFDPIHTASSTVRLAGGVGEQAHHSMGAALDQVWLAAGLLGARGLSPEYWIALECVKKAYWAAGRTQHTTIGGGFVEPSAKTFSEMLQAAWEKNM